jgi:tetratricopeptide (TPR) repeat protein
MALPAAVRPAAPPSPQAPANELLDAYETGQYDRVPGAIRTLAQGEAVYQSLVTDGPAWIAAGSDPAAVSRRRVVAATFVLEVAGLRLSPFGDDPVQRDVRLKLIAWGGSALTTSQLPGQSGKDGRPSNVDWYRKVPSGDLPVLPIEALWFRAAAVVLQRADWGGLIEDSTAVVKPSPAYPLFSLALKRFPKEPNLLLARAAAEERVALITRATPAGMDEDPRFIGEVLPGVEGRVGWARQPLLDHAAAHFKDLTVSDVVGAEAALRLGYKELAVGRRALAREWFGKVRSATSDPYLLFLSQLFAAVAWERDGRAMEAEGAYRAALEVVPRVRSASTLLAALLFRAGRRPEATALLEAGLLTRPVVDDPWRVFLKGTTPDTRRWPALLIELRDDAR